jgi:hypothetical protein
MSMDVKTKALATLTENGWVEDPDFPGLFVRGNALKRRERPLWVAEVPGEIEPIADEVPAGKIKSA